jgi:hypothetical protein
MRTILVTAVLLASAASAQAQTSASYKLQESVLNSGGHPAQGSVLSSASYHVRLDAIGDGALGLASASFHVDGGFVDAYPPPGEVLQQIFSSSTTQAWSPERSVGRYEVYRDSLTALSGGGTGACFTSGLSAESASDTSDPAVGQGWFYLVTARNRLGEEGTKGFRSDGSERPNPAACP